MTQKEQIARKYVQCTCDEIFTSRNLTAPDCPYHSSDVESAMDEYSELRSVAFGEYLGTFGWEMCNPVGIEPNKWVSHINVQLGIKTTSELYKLFLQSQQPNT